MWIDNEIIKSDLEYITSVSFVDWEKFRGASVFITGGTGLIGSWLVNSFIYANMKFELCMSLCLLVRDVEKAKKMFCHQIKEAFCNVIFIEDDVKSFDSIIECDYVIHAANPTASDFFVEHPVETIKTAVCGTMNLLEAVKTSSIKGFIFLSSMEVYGHPNTDEKIEEGYPCNLDLSSSRSSYPESKRLCESLCVSYCNEFNIPIRIIRLTQTFGPGVKYNDQRVFAQFARSVIENRNIILATKGQTKRSYLYTADAVTAILTVLLNGNNGEAYNAANEETYCSIFDMAKLVVDRISGNKISIEVHTDGEQLFKYAPFLCMNLDTKKLRMIGWQATSGLVKAYKNMIHCIYL